VASIISHKPEKTFALGGELAAELRAGDVVALVGELGAGKTQFVKGLAAGLGYAGEVTSPSFTLLHEYAGGRVPLYHFDFYRLETARETATLSLEEYLEGDGVCVIEWAGKFPDLLPSHTRWFELAILPDDRRELTERTNPG